MAPGVSNRGCLRTGRHAMFTETRMTPPLTRRRFLQLGAGLAGLTLAHESGRSEIPTDKSKPTQFQIACMTLPYAAFPLERALAGIKAAGYKYVAWGTSH